MIFEDILTNLTPPSKPLGMSSTKGACKVVSNLSKISSNIILSNFCLLNYTQKWLPKLGTVPPGYVLDKGGLLGGVKFVEITSNIIMSNFCLLK